MLNLYPAYDYWNEVYQRLISSILDSQFFRTTRNLLAYKIVPWPFLLEAGEPGRVLHFTINSEGRGYADRTTTTEKTVVSTGERDTVQIRLGLGKNEITVRANNGETFYGVWNTARFGTILSGIAKELYDNVTIGLQTHLDQIYSPFSSKIIEHLLPYQDFLTDVRAARILQAKMSIRSIVNSPSSDRSVTDFLTSLTLGTPIFKELQNSFESFDYSQPIFHESEHFGGFDAHIWLPNPCVTEWVTFVKLMNAIDVYSLQSVSEREVSLLYSGAEERHRFGDNLAESECSVTTLLVELGCIDSLSIQVTSEGQSRWSFEFCSYGLDNMVERCHLLGIRKLDCDVELDSGTLDTYDDFDPEGDGWEGRSLSGRLDGMTCMDTLIKHVQVPEKVEPCYKWGMPITPLFVNYIDVETDPEPALWYYIGQFIYIEPPVPIVLTFLAVPSTVTVGNPLTLSWTTQHATHVDIDHGVGVGLAANGSIVDIPPATQTYTITAHGPGGTATDTVSVTVLIPGAVPLNVPAVGDSSSSEDELIRLPEP